MAEQARTLAAEQKRQVAEFLSGRPLAPISTDDSAGNLGHCASSFADPLKGPAWNGWGVDLGNSRFQPADGAGLIAEQVPNLKLKWAFGFVDSTKMFGQPTVAGGRVYIGGDNRNVYSLDAKTGCQYWTFRALSGVRTAPVIAAIQNGYAVYFGDLSANVYAVDAKTGKQIWEQRADTHPAARITGAPMLAQGRLYVPVASVEEIFPGDAKYECCTFRGSIIAYDAETGKQLWKSYMIPGESQRTTKTSQGTQLWGPAGAGVWSAPTVDLKRGLLYVATGDAYTAPAPPTTDAVIALDLKTGRIVWTRQMTENDAFVVADCDNPKRLETCPAGKLGPDFDFGSSVILRTLPDGRDILAVGQKSGIGWGLDPEKQGAIVWQHRVGKGSTLGGIEWGAATDGRLVFFANADAAWGPEQAGGLAAVKLESGERVWFTRPPPIPCAGNSNTRCVQAQPAAVTAIPGVVFSGATNGIMRAYAAGDGKIIWEYDTVHSYSTVNGVAAKGGGISGPGPTVAGGMVYFGSGYDQFGIGAPGNVLLAFGLE